MSELASFYHVYAAGNWRDSVAEHLAALEDGAFTGDFHVGVIGSDEQVDAVRVELGVLRPPTSMVSAHSGWEQFTLTQLRAYARFNSGYVMYGHTKGSYNIGHFQDVWRQWMTWHVVTHWEECVEALEKHGADAIGCHWLTAEAFPGVRVDTPFPMFGGNFWIASCDYVRELPSPPLGTRHDAEAWIGLNDPKVLDLSPGWPGTWPYPHRPMRRLVAGI